MLMSDLVELLVMLLVILVAAEVFTNALEHLGERLGISEGVTGSLFAAVGTAMPESMVPLLAFFAGGSNQAVNEEIGVGAILGAPLMLSTLSLFLMTIAVTRSRGVHGHLRPERTGLRRDLDFFLVAFALAALALFVPNDDDKMVHSVLALVMLLIYFFYVLMTVRASADLVRDGHGTEAHSPMFLSRLGLPENMAVIILQIAIGLGLLIFGAKGFIHGVEVTSEHLGVSALFLSLLIVPIATELPEKVNSILWIRRGKDTLAFGNITGAMVFQGTVLPAIGLLLTPWAMRKEVLAGIIVAFVAAAWLRYCTARGDMRVWQLFVNGALYVSYIVFMVV
jgi:cation:H+ antiporter